MQTVIALDTETFLIGPDAIAPKLVCASFSDGEGALLVGNDSMDNLKKSIVMAFEEFDIVVGHNISYDLTVIAEAFPDLLPMIFAKLAEGKVHDTRIREKLHNLGTHGKMDFKEMPDGSTRKLSYRLMDLELKYLQLDRSEDKLSAEAWRMNYKTLDGMPVEKYPAKAAEYAIEDAVNTFKVYEAQRVCKNLLTEGFQVAVDFALRMMTVAGWKIDSEEVTKLETWLDEALEDQSLLEDANILRPAQPPRPYVNGACDIDGNPKMTAGKAASVNKKALGAYIEDLCEEIGIEPEETAKGAVSTASAFLAELAPYDNIIEAYVERQKLQKLKTTYLPNFKWDGEFAERVHPSFDVLKESGRTSSYTNRLFPSCNIQQVDPRVRGCYIADNGFVLVSSDYSSLELCSLAWRLREVVGSNTMLSLIKRGVDLHAYLGMHMAYEFKKDFREACGGLNTDQRYELFMSLKTAGDEEKAFFKKYRTFAKPTGLGYPGGLGAETFVTYAKATFDVDLRAIAEEMDTLPDVKCDSDDPAIILATHMKEIWFTAFPEMRQYFQWVSSQLDSQSTKDDPKYSYETPLGMVRRMASYCAATNGAGMQSPAAEGAKLAVFEVVRKCWDSTMESPLYGSVPLAFIHDEIIIEVPDDETRTACCKELSDTMVEAMQAILTGIPIEAEPCMMYRWDKYAEPKYEKGELVPCESR